ncbi:MAG: RNA polymerase sigma factor [Candidatus Riflebacteria bacterium]|nr:RNA polymerase sigma factor [Candidatus Riflebacteria bacterium]
MNAASSMGSRDDDLSLIEGLKSREPHAFEIFVETFGPAIFRFSRLKLGDAAAAEDASQEIFLKAFMKIDTLNSERLFPWVLKIARNHCFDILRKRMRTPETPVDFTADAIDRVGDEALTAEAINRTSNEAIPEMPSILLGLTGQEREIVLLRVIEELEYCDIAQITGMVEGSIRNAFSRAMRRLREGAESDEM